MMAMILFFSAVGIAFYKMFFSLPNEKEILEAEQTTYEHSKAAV